MTVQAIAGTQPYVRTIRRDLVGLLLSIDDEVVHGRELLESGRSKGAGRLLRRAAAAGHPGAIVPLSRALRDSDGAASFELLSEAAASGHADARCELAAQTVVRTRGRARFFAACGHWISAARLGSAEAYVNLGHAYAYGAGVGFDRLQALGCYARAAERGNAEAREALARIPSIGSPTSVPQRIARGRLIELNIAPCSLDVAYREFCAAAETGHPMGLAGQARVARRLGFPVDEVARILVRAAHAGCASSMVELARLSVDNELPADPATAAMWLERAAAAGAFEAEVLLARLNLESHSAETREFALARLRRAAEAGFRDAMVRLGKVLVHRNTSVAERRAGAAWLIRAAWLGSGEAFCELSDLSVSGRTAAAALVEVAQRWAVGAMVGG